MKRVFLSCALLAVAMAAQERREPRAPKKPAAKPAEKAAPKLVLPAGAVRIDAHSWRHTDAQGKTWKYVESPFGMTRFEMPAAESAPADAPPDMKAFEDGDKVRFERPSPFGVIKWTRKKDEMTAQEQRVWERDRPKPPEEKPEKEPR